MNRHFASGREFSLIETLFDPSHFARNGEGLGDDGFLLRLGGETWAVSTDASVEGVHYRLDWASPEAALEKAVLSNLSDINAMGGKTLLAFLNLGALKSWDRDQIEKLGATLARLEERHGFRVAGGDTVRKERESFFSITVMGRIEGKPLLRSQARPGHRIYVSGPLGASAAGLSMLNHGFRPETSPAWKTFFDAHLHPSPPLDLGPLLGSCSHATAAIDISDGLSSELWHLSRQSGCRMVIEWSKLAYDKAMADLPGGEAWMDWVLNGGEGYQLLFTGDFSEAELGRLALLAEIREIGSVRAGEGVGMVDDSGTEREMEAAGWSH